LKTQILELSFSIFSNKSINIYKNQTKVNEMSSQSENLSAQGEEAIRIMNFSSY
jgi:hypothetical protein